MTEPWFPKEIAPYFSLLSLFAILAVLEWYAERGRNRIPVFAVGVAATVFAAALLVSGVAAVAVGQPRFVSAPLLLSGLVLLVVCVGGLVRMRQLYAEAEIRKMTAQDL